MRNTVLILAVPILLSACAALPFQDETVPTAHTLPPEPVPTEIVLPSSLALVVPVEHTASIARFISRTLETAPNGQARRWPSPDKDLAVSVRPEATEISSDRSLCRRATMTVGLNVNRRDYPFRVCRNTTGVWEP